jgi:hypothetical protein
MVEPTWIVHEVKYATCKVNGVIFVVRRSNGAQTEWSIWGKAGGKLASGAADTFEGAQQAALEANRALGEAGE